MGPQQARNNEQVAGVLCGTLASKSKGSHMDVTRLSSDSWQLWFHSTVDIQMLLGGILPTHSDIGPFLHTRSGL